MKKIISLILCAALLLSTIAFAETGVDISCDCGETHASNCPNNTCLNCGATGGVHASDCPLMPFLANIGNYAEFDSAYSNFPIIGYHPSGIASGDAYHIDNIVEFDTSAVPAVKIVDVALSSDGDSYWYKIEAVAGIPLPENFPEEPWVFQDFITYPGGASLIIHKSAGSNNIYEQDSEAEPLYATAPATEDDESAYDYSASIGMNAEVDVENYYVLIVSADKPSEANVDNWLEFDTPDFEDVIFKIEAYTVVTETDGEVPLESLWYQVSIVSGTAPEDFIDYSWILQNYLGEEADEFDTLILREANQCPACGEYDCKIEHVWCDICGEYDCGEEHKDEPACECCENCTGEDGCECGCDDCVFAPEDEPELDEDGEITGTVTDSEGNPVLDGNGNPLEITVTGEGIPEGATVVASVPETDGEKLPNVFDIKVMVDGEEWQPIDYGETVTLSIPVDTDTEYVDVVHFIDYAPAIHDDVEYVSIADATTDGLIVLADAIEASDLDGYVAVEVMSKIPIIDGVVEFATNSFSVYDLVGSEFQPSSQGTTIEFNNGLDGANDENTVVGAPYYATPDTEFTFTTTTVVLNSAKYSTYFTVKSGGEYVTLSNENRGITVTVDVTISPDTPAGTSLKILYATSGFLGSKAILREIIIVRPVTIEYRTNLPDSFNVSGMPEGRIDNGTTDNKFITDGNKAKYTIPDNEPTATDPENTDDVYVFKGWSTKPDGKVGDSNFYAKGTEFTPIQDTVLYAIWDADYYYVDYDLNGGAGNVPEKKWYEKGSVINLPAVEPTKANVRFLGWSVSADGSSELLPAGSEYTVNSKVTFHAIWGVDVTVKVSGGTLTLQQDGEFSPTLIENTALFTWDAEKQAYTATLVEGYLKNAYFIFEVSNSSKVANGGTDNSSISVTNLTDQKVQATTTAAGILQHTQLEFSASDNAQYYITFDTVGGSSVSSITRYRGQDLYATDSDFPKESPTKQGYSFDSWLYKGVAFTGITNIQENITLTAKWETKDYYITLTLDGGTLDLGNGNFTTETTSFSYNIEDTLLQLPPPTKEGNTFTGWKVTTAGGSWVYGNVYSGAFANMYGDVTLTAQWTANSHKVTYTVDGEQYSESTATYGTTVTLLAEPTKTGYSFSGWNVSGATVTDNKFTMPDNDVTITGSFTAKEYTLTWTDGYGNELYALTADYGTPVTYPAAPSKGTGYIFVDWDKHYTTMPATDDTITAIWEVTVSTEIQNGGTVVCAGFEDFEGLGVVVNGTFANSHSIDLPAHPGIVLGDGATITATPATGYKITGVTVNGAPVNSFTDSEYVYTVGANGVEEPISIVVTTSEITYTIKYQLGLSADRLTNAGEFGNQIKKYGETVNLNGTVPTAEGATFLGWDANDDKVKDYDAGSAYSGNSDLTLVALWDPTPYYVNYTTEGLDAGDKATFVSQQGYYGDPLTIQTPAVEGYTITKITVDGVGVSADYSGTFGTKDIDVIITYSKNAYTITWYVDGKTTEESYKYGDMPIFKGSTDKSATAQYTYTFAGWSPAISRVTGNQTYTAQYTETLRKYTVTWKNDDGTVLETDENVPYGTTPTYNGEAPTKASTQQYTYHFAGWSPAVEEVTGNVEYTATFSETVNTYTVTWKAWNDVVIETDGNVPYGTTPSYDGTTPTRPADDQYTYTFAGWSPAISAVTGDVEYTATFTKTVNTYTVTWIVDGKTTTESYEYGATPSFKGSTHKESDAQYSYSFTGWSPAITTVTGDATYTAQYSSTLRSYTITWNSGDGKFADNSTVKTTTVYYGETPVAPEEPTRNKTGYTCTFDKWTPDIVSVTGPATYTATYTETINQYTITFDTDGGSTIAPITQDYGTAITPPADPTKTGYTFTGWDKEIPATMPAENMTITAQWKVNQYTITFDSNGGSAVESITQDYSSVITAPADPTRTGYTFTGWDKEIPATMPAEDMTVTAQWTANTYYVVFNANGGIGTMGNQTFTYDVAQALTENAFTRSGYTFEGWNTQANGKGTPYTDGQSVINLTAAADGEFTLYAQWKEAYADLTITATGADNEQTFIYVITGTPDDNSINGGQNITLTVAVPAGRTVVIKELPVGTYKVYEQGDWNWRYANQEKSFRFTVEGITYTSSAETQSHKIPFDYNNTVTTDKWLNDYYRKRGKGKGAGA